MLGGKQINPLFYQIPIGFFLLIGTYLIMFPPNQFWFRSVANYAVPMMFGLMIIAVLFLILRDKRLTFLAFGCCAALAFYLRGSHGFEQKFRFSFAEETSEPEIKIAHFTTSSLADDYETGLEIIREVDADLVSIQEVTPDWAMLFQDELALEYPHQQNVLRIDLFGLTVLSKYPFVRADTFNFEDIPNLIGSVKMDSTDREVIFVSSHTTPPVNSDAYTQINKHLSHVAGVVESINDTPLVSMGSYHCVPWSSEIQAFRNKAKLNDGRRGFSPSIPNPQDYIFFNNALECLDFKPVMKNSVKVGIEGTYQFTYQGKEENEESH